MFCVTSFSDVKWVIAGDIGRSLHACFPTITHSRRRLRFLSSAVILDERCGVSAARRCAIDRIEVRHLVCIYWLQASLTSLENFVLFLQRELIGYSEAFVLVYDPLGAQDFLLRRWVKVVLLEVVLNVFEIWRGVHIICHSIGHRWLLVLLWVLFIYWIAALFLECTEVTHHDCLIELVKIFLLRWFVSLGPSGYSLTCSSVCNWTCHRIKKLLHFRLRFTSLGNRIQSPSINRFLVLPRHGSFKLLSIWIRESAGSRSSGMHRSYDYVSSIVIKHAVTLELAR